MRQTPAVVLKHLVIKRLHGYLSKEVALNERITLLVGINGSGKTSVLNVLNWLLVPSLADLCTVEFEELSLAFRRHHKDYVIRCTQSDKQLMLQVHGGGELRPLRVVLFRPARELPFGALPDVREHYATLRPEKHEADTWNFLAALPKPVVLGLDRRARRTQPTRREGRRHESNPVEEVQRLAQDGFAEYRNEAIRFNDELKDKILLLAFDVEISRKPSTRRKILISDDQITTLEERVRKYLEQSAVVKSATARGEHVSQAVAGYFKQIRASAQAGSEAENRALQFERLQRLISFFEEFEVRSEQAYRRIHAYLTETNRFLRDSAKYLLFTARTNELVFDLLDKSGKPQGRTRSLELLSSGEKQILVLLTHLSFDSGHLFILDEPELSLHPKWQDEFLAAVDKLMAPRTQLIIATHSPAIVGQRTESCVPLLPYHP
jgi:predicted ATPase